MIRRSSTWTLQLPQTAEYALRALAYMATLPPDQAVKAQDLSHATSVPVHYLSKVMRRLVTSGLVLSQKGHGGGFLLARPAAKISLGDVLAAGELGPTQLDRCAFGWGKCNARSPCPLHGSFSQLKELVHAWATRFTLADVHDYATQMSRREGPLVQLTKRPRPPRS